jgi:hypothetical protein
MRSLFFFAIIFFTLVAMPTKQAHAAACAGAGNCPDASCAELGKTMMSDDHASIIACMLSTGNLNPGVTTCAAGGGCKWKATAGGGGAYDCVTASAGWASAAQANCPAGYTMIAGSCNMYRGGDGREISPRYCYPNGNGYYCNEGNSGSCIAYARCCK